MKSRLQLLLLAATLPVWAADDPNTIVKRFIEAEKKNTERASQYTYVEQAQYFNFDKKGQQTKERSETHEIIFIEGGEFKKLVARNDKPLESKEQSKEDKKLQRVAEERRKARRSGFTHKVVSLGTNDDLLTLFDNRLVGEEEVRGRKVWVIESTPKEGHAPANAHEKDVLSFRRKLWIDQTDYVLIKDLHTAVGQHIVWMPGATIAWEYEKINDDAWMVTSGVLDGRIQFAKLIKPRIRTEYTNSKFQKFDVQSTITIDEVK